MNIFHMPIEMCLVTECRRADSAWKTNAIVIFLVRSQIAFNCKRGWTLPAFKHFFKFYKVTKQK